ncbi:uncharacterized protein A4U43_C02F18280 [Asparagus officinalis]|uniref:Uncharacterized protein n=1 Tax=Asparagus officinalis TaxID=4686 RepID=A0A5P1FP25_ASPOF|nr:uncharacterized protein A4U43_C02F18280 [Asparagus officinalis]
MSTSDSDTEPDPSPVPQSILDALSVATVADPSLLCRHDPSCGGHVVPHVRCIEPWLLAAILPPCCRLPATLNFAGGGADWGEDVERRGSGVVARGAYECGRRFRGSVERPRRPGALGSVILAAVRAIGGLLLAYGTGSPGSIESTGSTSVSGLFDCLWPRLCGPRPDLMQVSIYASSTAAGTAIDGSSTGSAARKATVYASGDGRGGYE